MPIGVDGGLAPRTGGKPSPLSMPNLKPPMISDASVQASVNNTMAASAGAGRSSLMAADRAGVSRGRGHAYRAQMEQASAAAQAEDQAAQTVQDANNSNAAARSAYDAAMRGEQLQGRGLLEGLRNTQAMGQLQRQGIHQDQLEAMARGAYGLSSIQLDKTPLLQALMR